jgi:DNA topoisomerase-3
MEIMEKLYNRGYISYPRTETNKYNKTINLRDLVSKLTNS